MIGPYLSISDFSSVRNAADVARSEAAGQARFTRGRQFGSAGDFALLATA